MDIYDVSGSGQPLPNKTTEESARNQWYEWVEDYSSRFMTFEKDKLPAMAGLENHYRTENCPDDTYLAGLWMHHLPGSLLWRLRRVRCSLDELNIFAAFHPRRPINYRAPTWSWASLDGDITYVSQRVTKTSSRRPQTSLELCEVTKNTSNLWDSGGRSSITINGDVVPLEI